VIRQRLIERLSSDLDRGLILISAPAGYGKSTLVSSWLRDTDIPSAWLSLDEGDNDPIRYLQYFISALQRIVPTIQPDLLGVLQEKQPDPFEALLNILINEIDRQATPFVLVLDDFHTIQAQPVLEMVSHLLEHMPPQMHLVLLTRTDPPLPFSRLRVRNQLAEIRADQLRFTREEIAIFLNEAMGLRLSTDDLVALEMRTEGWIAGLQLAAIALQSHIAMQGGKDIHSFISAFTGSNYYIIDYLTEEVLKRLPERVSLFLLQTSILGRICGPLCEAVVENGTIEQNNGQAILEDLERMNLFLIPLDDERRWYRYHHLFAEVVNQRLKHLFPRKLPELHRRASHWYEQNAMIAEATHHAIIAGDQARAAQLVEQNGCSLLMRGEGFTLLKWVESVVPYTQTHPWLSILKAWGLALTGHLDQVEPTLRTAEGLFSPLDPAIEAKIMLGSIAAVRAHMANLHGETQLAANYAHGALEYLPVSNEFSCSMRSVATSIRGDASWLNGNLDEAKSAYLEAVQISQAADNIYMTIIAKSNLADILIEQGELHQAARIYTETLQNARRPDRQEPPTTDRLFAGLGGISYEWNHLEVADQHTQRCIELCQQWGNYNLLAKSYMMLAWLEQARSNPIKAQEAMRAAEEMLSEQRLSPRQSEWVRLACAGWWIIQGNLERATQLLQQSGGMMDGILSDTKIPFLREPEYILLIRLRLAQGDFEAALALAERLLPLAEAGKRTGRVIEILILQALGWQGKKEPGRALVVLEKALTLAEPEGYTRVFLDEGEPMRLLILDCRLKARKQARDALGYAHAGRIAYLDSLLSTFSLDTTDTSQSKTYNLQSPLVEPLTRRELELLKLIEAGSSNQDIANRLVISIPTVKRHISNIYAKLGAKSRTQAVALGRELRLLV
jgi:LuxR family maltose regulon positive regulatory protein